MKPQGGGVDGTRAAWVTAGLVIFASILSTLTLSTPTTTGGRGGGDLEDGSASEFGSSLEGDLFGSVEGGIGSQAQTGGGAGARTVTRRTGSYDCSKGQNAGAADVGVTAKEIWMAATVVKTGIARDFLSDAQWGMEAVRRKVNRAGGICGRILNVEYRNDQWNKGEGQRIIKAFIGENKYLGLAINPSSEGLRGAIESRDIRNNGFPVVGADGMLIGQYTDPWVWPVATSTSSVMHIMARHAFERLGARKFGIVWENNYRFGVEGHAAFAGSVQRLGGTITSDVSIQEGQTDYSNKVSEFIGKCGGVNSLAECEFIALLLEPVTASQWVRNGGLGNGDTRPSKGIGAPQPLFLDSFARDCAKYCANMWVWTSFRPPIPPFDTEQAVATYKSDLAAVSTPADANNPHVQGAYVGMVLLVEALKKLGPAPTRADLQRVLDTMELEAGLAPALRFRPGFKFAANSAQAFEAVVVSNSFSNWRYTNSGFIADTEVGMDIPPE